MKLSCEIVQDLLPLYEDGLCSEASRTSIEEHLKECPACRELLESMREFPEPDIPEIIESKEEQVVAKSFRKVRRRWKTSLVAMLLIVPILVMSVNQIRSVGICFTNLDEIWLTGRYVNALVNGNYEKVASYMDYEHEYRQALDYLELKLEDFEKKFVKVTLDGKEWMVTEEYYQQYFANQTDAQNIWSDLILNKIPEVMVPVETWEAIMELHQDISVKRWDVTYKKDNAVYDWYYEVNGVIYVGLESDWGTFIIEEDSIAKHCQSAGEFYVALSLLPMEIYEDAKDEITDLKKGEYQHIREKYQELSNMTLEEFTEFMKEYYAEQIADAMESGFSLKNKGYDECYYLDGNGHWTIGYSLELSYKGKEYSVTAWFAVEDGKIINCAGTSWKGEYLDETEVSLTEALILDYPIWD